MDVKKPDWMLSFEKNIKQNYVEYQDVYAARLPNVLVKTHKDTTIRIEVSLDCDFFKKTMNSLNSDKKIDLSDIGESDDFWLADTCIQKMDSCVFIFFKRTA